MPEYRYSSSKWVRMIIVLGIAAVIVSLYYVKNEHYELMWMIPLSYTILTVLFKNLYEHKIYDYGVGFWSINVIMLCRYIITPTAIIFTNIYGRIGPTPEKADFNLGIALMVYEMLCVFLTIRITSGIIARKGNKIKDKTFFNDNYVIIIIFLVISFVILLKYPGSIVPEKFFVMSVETDDTVKDAVVESTGLSTTLRTTFKMVLFLVVIAYFNKKYKKSESNIWGALSLGMLFVFLGLNTGSSRWTIILNALLGTYLLVSLYPKLKYPLLISISAVVAVSFISISIYKFYYIIGNSENHTQAIIENMLTMFEDYFSGPRLVAQSIDLCRVYKNQITIQTLIDDLLVTVPFIHKFFDEFNISNVYFNAYNLGGFGFGSCWLILPMIGEGYMFFGVLGAPLFTILFEALAIRFDYKAVYTNSREEEFLFFFGGIWCSLCLAFCSQIIFNWILAIYLPTYILLKLNQKICL